MDIIVLAGGLSPERDVSLSSGALVANALVESGHRVCVLDLLIGSDKSYTGLDFVDRSKSQRFSHAVPATAPDLGELSRLHPDPIGPGVLAHCQRADVVFVALHGAIGENGQLQSLFDLHRVRYTGTGYVGSLLAMDKDLAKSLVAAKGIPTAPWSVLDLRASPSVELAEGIRLPCAVKPLSCGSSVGVSLVKRREDLVAALEEAGRFERKVLVESLVEGREVSCAVLGGKALPVIEIVPKSGFYNYENKYQKGLAEELCPAPLDAALAAAIQERALLAHETLRLGFYSRTDFIVDAGGEAIFLESNTLPGMTPTSLLPQEAKAAGIGYNELCDLIVGDAQSSDWT